MLNYTVPAPDPKLAGMGLPTEVPSQPHPIACPPANTTTLAELKSSPTPAAVTDSSATRTAASEAKRRTAARLQQEGANRGRGGMSMGGMEKSSGH